MNLSQDIAGETVNTIEVSSLFMLFKDVETAVANYLKLQTQQHEYRIDIELD